MEEMVRLLLESPLGSFATVEDGQPRVRPWGLQLAIEGRLYFCTDTTKNVYKQLQAFPYAEYTNNEKDGKWVRVRGRVKFIDDLAIKEKILDDAPHLKSYYKSASNPIFVIFIFEHGLAGIYEYGKEPQLIEI